MDKDYVNIHVVKKTIGDVNIQYSCQFCRKRIRLIDIANDIIHFTVKNLTFMDIFLEGK